MKKALGVILVFCYLVGISGISFSLHYCGKHFQYISLSGAKEKDSCCGKHGQKSCCNDKEVSVKKLDDQRLFKHFTLSVKNLEAPAASYICLPELKTPGFVISKLRFFGTSPPLLRQLKIYLLHCVFLI